MEIGRQEPSWERGKRNRLYERKEEFGWAEEGLGERILGRKRRKDSKLDSPSST